MIRLAIADDHPIVRAGLIQILSNIPDMIVVAEAESGDHALNVIRNQEWDVLMLDINMPGKHVLDLLKISKEQHPERAILILSIYPEDEYAIRMLQAGADGYLTKQAASEQLVTAIRKLAEGKKYISDSLVGKLVNGLNVDSQSPLHTCLTDREFQVFYALGAGKSLTDIAKSLSLSVKTVGTYRTRAMKKMKMTTNAQIVLYVSKCGDEQAN